MNTPLAPVSWGELIDKVTILEIKTRRLSDPAAVRNVQRELSLLEAEAAKAHGDVGALRNALAQVNETLWDIEDRIRDKEAARTFDAEFIELARSVYKTNDRRAAIKREINLALSSGLIEEKSYKAYD